MRRAGASAVFVIVVAASLLADSNLRIDDVGLHGYWGTPAAVSLIVRNPSMQAQSITLRVTVADNLGELSAVTSDLTLNGGEERRLELPVLLMAGEQKVRADAAAGGVVFAHDTYQGTLRQTNLIVLMCGSESECKSAQSQIEFSGTVEQRVGKNREFRFETLDKPREHWWAYSGANAIVAGVPMASFTPAQRDALEGFLRCGGRLVLLEREIEDPEFLSAYRQDPAPKIGQRVGRGILFRISELDANMLGNAFSTVNLPGVFALPPYTSYMVSLSFISRHFATRFNFPRLGSLVVWLAVYIIVIGLLNFGVLRRLGKLEYGWISTCVLALLFAAGFYYSSASKRPHEFRLDNLGTYYLDDQSPLAAADYSIRISAPKRRDVLVSIADPAVFTTSDFNKEETTSEIWSEMNRQAARASRQYDIFLGPPREVDLSMLKWSFRDLNLRGLRRFPGTIHLVAPNRLRNDAGQRFEEAVYLDMTANKFYTLPAISPQQEIDLDSIAAQPITAKRGETVGPLHYPEQTLSELARSEMFRFAPRGKIFAGLSDGPALPVGLNVDDHQDAHFIVIVSLE